MKKLLVFLLCFTLLIPSFSISAKDNVYSLDDMSEDKIVDYIFDRATDFSYTNGEVKYLSDSNTDGYDGDFVYSAELYYGQYGNHYKESSWGYKYTVITFCIKEPKRAKSIYTKLFNKLTKYNKIYQSTDYRESDILQVYTNSYTNDNHTYSLQTLLKDTSNISGYYVSRGNKYSQNINTYFPIVMTPISTGYVIKVTCYEPLAITSPGEEIDIDDSAKFDLGELEDTPEFKLSNTKGYKLKITFDSKDNYEIQIATDKSFKNVVKEESINVANKTYTLEKGTYYVRVKYAIDSQSSDWSEVKTIKIKK